jgi:LacI family transcriptional regulator
VDGIIWSIPEVGGNRTWSRTKGRNLPVPILLVGGMAGTGSLPSIAIDNAAIGRIATEHILAGDARQVGLITGPLTWWEAQERERGWRETLEANRLPTHDRLVVEGDWSANSGEQGLYQLVERTPDIDAVFACNDQMALGVLHGAHRLGRRVPEDLSVVGVDNIAEGSHFWPSLTTVDQPLRAAGALAVRQIDQLIRIADQARLADESVLDQITLLEPELIVRESSRVPAGTGVGGAVSGPVDRYGG